MIAFNSDSNYLDVALLADPTTLAKTYNLYTGSTCGLDIARTVTPQLSTYIVALDGTVSGVTTSLVSLTYTGGPKGELSIPLRRLMEKYGGMTDDGKLHVTVIMYDYGGNTEVDRFDFTAIVLPGAPTSEVPMPVQKDGGDVGLTYGQTILPPNVIIAPPYGGGIIVESNFTDIDNVMWYKYGTSTQITPTGPRYNMLEVAYGGATGLTLSLNTKTRDYVFQVPPSCADLLLVQWTSLTGATRRHVFPVVSWTRRSEKVGVMTEGDGVKAARNTVTGVRCRLTGLTEYGYWYYHDLIGANDVKAVHCNPYSSDLITPLEGPFSDAEVLEDSVETPSGGQFYNFEFTINLRHYDSY